MALYTELFSEYLENNTMPEILDELTGFADLLKARFYEREIGFETEQLFSIKLAYKSEVVVNKYKARYNAMLTLTDDLLDFDKKTTATTENNGTITENNTSNLGEQKSKRYELPINETTATPSEINDAEATTNTNNGTTTNANNGTTSTTEKMDYETKLRVLDALNTTNNYIIENMLKEFEPLFMGVFL